METNFSVRYKLKSERDSRLLPIKSSAITVLDMKSEIFRSKCYGKGKDFDLIVFDPQTNQDYLDEGTLIPAYSSVLIRRVPGWPVKPIIVDRPDCSGSIGADNKVEATVTLSEQSRTQCSNKKQEYDRLRGNWTENSGLHLSCSGSIGAYNKIVTLSEPSTTPIKKQVEELDVNEFGDSILDFDAKVHVTQNTSAAEQISHINNSQCYDNVVKKIASPNFGRVTNAHAPGEFESKIPPRGYICHRCKKSGHYIKHCPTNSDPAYDIKRFNSARGIPRSMLLADPDGSYAINSGYVASLKPDEASFKKEIDGIPSSSSSTSNLPPELCCPLCKDVMKDAVMTKCCFSSFCDKCIRDHIITRFLCHCGARNTSADNLIPNLTLRKTIDSLLLSRSTSSGSGNSATSTISFQDLKVQAIKTNSTDSRSALTHQKRKFDGEEGYYLKKTRYN